jgi:hypothetical protein
MENYSFEDIKTILNAYQLPDQPFTTLNSAPVHVYYRVVRAVQDIDLVNDTVEYLRALLKANTLPSSERRVAIIFENGSMEYQVGKSRDTHFYSTQEVNRLLTHYLQGNNSIELFTALLGTDWIHGNELQGVLVEFNRQRLLAISRGQAVKDKVLIPVNVNQNHWVLFYIIYPEDAATLPTIYYFDPLGRALPDEVKTALNHRNLYPGVNINAMGHKVQRDGYNCGPWIIEAARAIMNEKPVPNASHDIVRARDEHMSIIYPMGKPDNSSWSLKNEHGWFALIACFKINHQKLADFFKLNKRTKQLVCSENLHLVATQLYREMELYQLVPFNQQTALQPMLDNIPISLQVSMLKIPVVHSVFENPNYKGVMFTDTLLQYLFEGNVQPFISIIDALNEHKIACALQLDRWFSAQKTNRSVNKLLQILNTLMQQQLLLQRCAMLTHIPHLDIVAHEYYATWNAISPETEKDWATILIHLPIATLNFLLRHRDNVESLLTQLQTEIDTQIAAIRTWEIQRSLPSILPPSWSEWSMTQAHTAKNYLWQRNQACAFYVIGQMMGGELTEDFPALSRITQRFLAMILKIGALLARCLPNHLRPNLMTIAQASDAERNSAVGAMLGLLFGVFINYYGGLFELLFSYSLIFLTELFHEQAKRVSAIQHYMPSISNLLRINMVLVLSVIALYTHDDYYFKRGLSALALSEMARRLFLRLTRELELTPAEQNAFSFLFTLVGSTIGTSLYSIYHDISASRFACEKAITEFKNLTAEQNLTYKHAESSFWLSPIWLSSSCSLRLRWGTTATTWQTDCTVERSFSGQVGVVQCEPAQQLPLMLTQK